MPAAPPPSVYDNMAAMPNVGGAAKSPVAAGGGTLDPKTKATVLAAYKAIDATFEELAKQAPTLREGLQGIRQSLQGLMSEKVGIDPNMMSGAESAPPTENKSPQEASAPPSGNKSPQEVPVPA